MFDAFSSPSIHVCPLILRQEPILAQNIYVLVACQFVNSERNQRYEKDQNENAADFDLAVSVSMRIYDIAFCYHNIHGIFHVLKRTPTVTRRS